MEMENPDMAGKPRKPVGLQFRLYERIREILESARAGVVRSVNTAQVVANWLIGREIVEEQQQGRERAGYGEALLVDLAERLTEQFGRGWSVRQLEYCRSFYLAYPALISTENWNAVRSNLIPPLDEIANAVRSELPAPRQSGKLNPNLSWTHYRTLMRVNRPEARAFYEIEASQNHWSARELERQVASLLFDRLAKSRDKKGLMCLALQGQEVARPIDVLKDPMVLEFLDLPESPRLVESKLEEALIDNLQHFLLELGKGFAFVSRQERITLDSDHFYIDLVFYHTILKCYVLIDLKVGKLTHADLGQIQFYVNYYDRERCTKGDHPTLGLILCPDKNDAVVKYTLGKQLKRNIFTSRYQLYLPTEEELQQELCRELRQLSSQSQQSTKKRTRKT
ncbi:PDDEXK nuclease domain-containing protein [Nitrosomonas sp.]|uniref:PDDEXK nuclease domain-containing protein n=1 Tax=Nitrosomonas sp. TaxID=42353 RepID=UPI0026160A2B|nr:PDDEXK nuclease domain-containing protein [Nitrosomonas sp.]MCW5602438.1 DUF1016 family protein [Nitrosomonas sp.]